MHARARPLALVLLLTACGHRAADTPRPVAPSPPPTEPAQPAKPTTPPPVATRPTESLTFDDDADPEPTTQIQAAPKRPPLPRFQLFGTRSTDGPN